MRSILLPTILIITVLISWASCFSPALRLSSSRVVLDTSHVILSATTATHQDEEKLKVQQLYQCQGCNTTFTSRNQLFKHLRGEDE